MARDVAIEEHGDQEGDGPYWHLSATPLLGGGFTWHMLYGVLGGRVWKHGPADTIDAASEGARNALRLVRAGGMEPML